MTVGMRKIPKEIKISYQITKKGNKIILYSPVYISIENPRVSTADCTITIGNNLAIVTLWRRIKHVHITLLGKVKP